MKNIIIASFILFSVTVSFAQFAGGSGRINDPYLIETAQHLDNVRNYLDSHFLQIADIDLNVPPWNTGEGWDPIGVWIETDHPDNEEFSGSYDGNGYVIDGLYVNRNANVQALFAFLYNTTIIQNVKLTNVNINGQALVSSLAAYVMNSTIINCYSNGAVTGSERYVGGLIGILDNSDIYNSHSEVIVRGGSAYVGGLIARAQMGSRIFDSYSIGEVRCVEGIYPGPQGGIGGLIGVIEDTEIYRCFSHSDIYVYDDLPLTGGLVGVSFDPYSIIEESYSEGNVNGNDLSGGLVGWMQSSAVRNSYSTSNVNGDQYVGGLIGLSLGSQYQDNLVQKSYSKGEVSGNVFVGGLIGSETYTIVIQSYWDIESSGQSTSAGGEGKLTVEMVQHDTFDNWDFQDTWEIQKHNPYILKTYPHLQWQGYAGLNNRLDNSLVKLFEDRNWHWDSFPRLERDQYGFQPAPEVLEPLEGTIDRVLAKPNQEYIIEMYWEYGQWQGYEIEFNSPDGYKLRTIDEEPYYLHVTGDRIDLSTQITLQPNTVNWIGYFIPSSQCPFEAFSEDTLERLEAIRAQNWSMRKDSQGNWVYAADPRPSMEYGKMYEIETSINEPLTFTWNIPHGYPDYLEPSEFTLADNPEYFDYTDSYDYESYFVEDIEDDEGLLEIGVLVDDQCVGATVFNESYPLELQAYTHEGHIGGNLSFELYYGRNRGTQRYRVVEVKDPQTGAYTAQTLRPRRQKFALVRIGSQQGMQTPQEPVVMEISNHPNPFNPDTTINFTVSSEQNVELIVYNIKGQKVTTLYDGSAAEGKHSVVWRGTDDRGNAVSSGMYFYRLKADNTELSGKMLLLK